MFPVHRQELHSNCQQTFSSFLLLKGMELLSLRHCEVDAFLITSSLQSNDLLPWQVQILPPSSSLLPNPSAWLASSESRHFNFNGGALSSCRGLQSGLPPSQLQT